MKQAARGRIRPEIVRKVGAGAMIIAGLALILPQTSPWLSRLASPLVNWAGERQARLLGAGLWGQAGIGVLLGLVWSPCVGPTLGAAVVLAAQGKQLLDVAITMAAFGLGIATLLLILALLAREVMQRWRGRLLHAASGGKRVLGVILAIVGLAILTGLDHLLEGVIVTISPDWLINLTTSI